MDEKDGVLQTDACTAGRVHIYRITTARKHLDLMRVDQPSRLVPGG